jgi:hypothetical protein
MLIIKKIVDFLRDQWLAVAIIALLIFMQVQSDMHVKFYQNIIKDLEKQIEEYKESDKQLQYKIDSLSSLEKDVIKEIQTIKEKEYVQIKVVDSMPISELQQFFSDRYPSGNSN